MPMSPTFTGSMASAGENIADCIGLELSYDTSTTMFDDIIAEFNRIKDLLEPLLVDPASLIDITAIVAWIKNVIAVIQSTVTATIESITEAIEAKIQMALIYADKNVELECGLPI